MRCCGEFVLDRMLLSSGAMLEQAKTALEGIQTVKLHAIGHGYSSFLFMRGAQIESISAMKISKEVVQYKFTVAEFIEHSDSWKQFCNLPSRATVEAESNSTRLCGWWQAWLVVVKSSLGGYNFEDVLS